MTCLSNFSGLRIVNYLTFTFTFTFFLSYSCWRELELQLPLPVVRDYLFKSRGRRITNYVTFTFACFIPRKLDGNHLWQHGKFLVTTSITDRKIFSENYFLLAFKLPVQHWRAEMLPKFGTSTGRSARKIPLKPSKK